MLNQERVKEMTKMAVFDENEGRRCRPMIQYFRKDYVARELLKSFVSGTIAYLLMGLVWVLYGAENLMESLNSMDIPELLTGVVLLYAIFMGVYFLVTYFIYNKRYTTGRQEVKKFYVRLKKVNKIYESEDQL